MTMNIFVMQTQFISRNSRKAIVLNYDIINDVMMMQYIYQ